MLNASFGVQRVIRRLPRTSRRPNLAIQPPVPLAERFRHGLQAVASAAHLFPARVARRRDSTHVAERTVPGAHPGIVARLGHERACAIVVAALVVGASAVSAIPSHTNDGLALAAVTLPSTGGVGGPDGDHRAPRIVVGGAFGLDRSGILYGDENSAPSTSEFQDLGPLGSAPPDEPATVSGPFLEDGTLLKPVSVETTVADAKGMLRTHKVKAGESLASIAKHYGVKLTTIYWASHLKSTSLKLGQVLTIPPVNGLVVTIGTSDTLASIAKKHKVEAAAILDANKLSDENLVIGQVLILPGAKGDPLPTPKPTPKPTKKPVASTGGGPAKYTGGRLSWPVAGGYISQYYHYGHYAIDIAADQGTTVKAAAAGKVVFAGWKNNGGGYQVQISHGSGLYTTYNHMSSLSVGTGQSVARGQRVGRVGATGWATGPHLHFEVWVGGIWNGGRRVNPLSYL